MQYYERVLMRVNGALAAHFNKVMPDETKEQMLGFVYSMKYEYQQRFDDMQVVGREADGKVEAILTPTGFVKKVRLHPSVASLPESQRFTLITSAVAEAKAKGRKLMAEAEMQVYGHFLRDLKPWLHGIRDNPEFFTIPEDAVETPEGILAPSWLTPAHIHRTIPFNKWDNRRMKQDAMDEKEKEWLETSEGWQWQSTVAGRRYVESLPENRPRGAPGRLMKEDLRDRNVAYTTARKDALEEYTKQKALFDMWYDAPATASPKARDIDRVLAGIMNEDITMRAAKVDWTVTRADDRAKARRDAQDQGLEPHFQNFSGFDLKKHWHVQRRAVGPSELYDYDTVRPERYTPGGRPTQTSGQMHGGWNSNAIHGKEEFERWTIARDPSRAPVGRAGTLSKSLGVKESWQSKHSRFPEAQANFA
eukprot:Rhum_TRINITY_DN5378_c0_g1::Rhum_TRINITY_DN5378_c0_g1_i1::g.17253::m.17253